MNKTFANLLDKYLSDKAKSNKNSGYYLNVMNNNEKESNILDQSHNNILIRNEHNHSNITVMEYLDYGNGFKGFEDRQWHYVICNKNETNYVDIRNDLIESWKESNARDTVIIINENGSVWEYIMSAFYDMESEIIWNDEGNVVRRFDLPAPKAEYDTEIVDSPLTVKYIVDSWQFLGHTTYTQFRSGHKFLVASYDNNGNLIKSHYMKSVRQMYAILKMDNYSLRTFQRKFKGDFVEQTLTNSCGKTFYITNLLTTMPPKTVVVESKEIEMETENLAEQALEIAETETENKVVEPKKVEIVNIPLQPKRIVVREPETENKNMGMLPDCFAALCVSENKPASKRIIIRA